MFGSDILEVAIGVVFLFCLLSLVATSLREVIEGYLQVRAVMLERGVRELLNDEDGTCAERLYNHPLISGLFRGAYVPAALLKPGGRFLFGSDDWKRARLGSKLPAYIPARNFALALMDMAGAATGTPDAPLTLARLRAGALAIPSTRAREAMLVAIDHAGGNLEQVRANLEIWFDSGMDRVSGWYRRHTQWVLLAIGLLLAVGFNVDTIHVARELMRSEAARTLIVAEAEAVVLRSQKPEPQATPTPSPAGGASAEKKPSPSTLALPAPSPPTSALTPVPTPTAASTPTSKPASGVERAPDLGCKALPDTGAKSCAQERLEALPFPIGWDGNPIWVWQRDSPVWNAPYASVGQWLGWFLTAVAVSLGAPFWFDMLNRLMVIRSTVKPHEKSREEPSVDRPFGASNRRAATIVIQTPPPPPAT